MATAIGICNEKPMDAHAIDCLDFAGVRVVLARYASCALGRGRIERMRPTPRATLVTRWLDQVRELTGLVEERGLPPFGGITDVRPLIEKCAPPLRVTAEQVSQIGATLAATHDLTRYLSAVRPAAQPELHVIAQRVGDFLTIADRIAQVIDPRGEVRDDASPKLMRIRREIEQVQGSILDAVDRLLRDASVRRVLQYANHTVFNDRIVLPVRTECRGRVPGIIHRTSDSGATIFVEPSVAVEMNNTVSQLRIAEQEEINRLLWDLTHEIYLNADEIRKTLDAIALLDFITAKVRFAKEFGARCPTITDDGRLNVRDARHPLLLDLFRQREKEGHPPSKVVPIDYRLGDDFRMLILTGPNTGGKTVTLKTIGLVALMVQAGLPVPVAEGSTMCLFRDVLIDIGDEQSMQQNLSTFSAHLRQLLAMLRRAREDTLVLIDELGAGTDPDEGAAIGTAMLDELLRRKARCVVTTHLGALKSFPLTRPTAENACVEFDMETLRPTYELSIGEPGRSHAIRIAERLGMPPRLVTRAERNLSQSARALRDALDGTSQVKRQAEEARKEADTARAEAKKAVAFAEREREKLARQQSDFQDWVQRVVHLQVGDAVRVRNFDRDGRIVRMRLDRHRAEVDLGAFSIEVPLGDILPPSAVAPPARAVPDPEVPEKRKKRKGGATPRRTGETPTDSQKKPPRRPARPRPVNPSLTAAQAEALTAGTSVYAKRFHRFGTVLRVNRDKQIVVVKIGLFEAEIPYHGLASQAPAPTGGG